MGSQVGVYPLPMPTPRTQSPAVVPAPVLALTLARAKDNPFALDAQEDARKVAREMRALALTMHRATVSRGCEREARSALRVAAQRLVRYTALYRALSLGDCDGGTGDALYTLCRVLQRQGLSDRTRNAVAHARAALR